MKHALIANNKIYEILNIEELKLQGWQEVPDNAKVGDVYDPQAASREDNLKTEMPPLDTLLVTLWESLVSGDHSKRDALEAQRQAILSKYPKG